MVAALISEALQKESVLGLLLAGGEARRMGGVDKGLLHWRGLSIAEHALRCVVPQVGGLAISCNRNQHSYARLLQKYAHPGNSAISTIVSDTALPRFSGPLAGIFSTLAMLEQSHLAQVNKKYRYLFVFCCDTPRLPLDIVQHLREYQLNERAQASYPRVNDDCMRLTLLLDLEAASTAWQRWMQSGADDLSVRRWLELLDCCELSMEAGQFGPNINRLADLGASPPGTNPD